MTEEWKELKWDFRSLRLWVPDDWQPVPLGPDNKSVYIVVSPEPMIDDRFRSNLNVIVQDWSLDYENQIRQGQERLAVRDSDSHNAENIPSATLISHINSALSDEGADPNDLVAGGDTEVDGNVATLVAVKKTEGAKKSVMFQWRVFRGSNLIWFTLSLDDAGDEAIEEQMAVAEAFADGFTLGE